MATNFDMDWGTIKEAGTGGNVDFMKLQSGANQLRIASRPSLIEIHWEKTVDGSQKKVICLGAGCPVCKAGKVPMSRYQVKVIDRADGKVKVLEGGPTIFNSIKNYAVDPDYGDPTKYDMKIRKDGAGRETKYTVVAAPKQTPLTDAEIKAIDESKSIEEINKAKNLDEIMQLGLECLTGSVGDLDASAPAGVPATGEVSDDDWNNL